MKARPVVIQSRMVFAGVVRVSRARVLCTEPVPPCFLRSSTSTSVVTRSIVIGLSASTAPAGQPVPSA